MLLTQAMLPPPGRAGRQAGGQAGSVRGVPTRADAASQPACCCHNVLCHIKPASDWLRRALPRTALPRQREVGTSGDSTGRRDGGGIAGLARLGPPPATPPGPGQCRFLERSPSLCPGSTHSRRLGDSAQPMLEAPPLPYSLPLKDTAVPTAEPFILCTPKNLLQNNAGNSLIHSFIPASRLSTKALRHFLLIGYGFPRSFPLVSLSSPFPASLWRPPNRTQGHPYVTATKIKNKKNQQYLYTAFQ